MVSPREVYVVARPTSDFAEQATFAANLKTTLYSWARYGRLERIMFLSTQLVYPTPRDETPAVASTELAPVGIYEYFKVELEGFTRWLGLRHDLDVEIVRLPLAYGGVIDPEQRKAQLLSGWTDMIMAGARFRFANDADRAFGNSFVFVPDLVEALVRPLGRGVHIRQPVSGHFTYTGLQQAVLPHAAPANGEELGLVRSQFFLRDEEAMPSRELATLVAEELRVCRRGRET